MKSEDIVAVIENRRKPKHSSTSCGARCNATWMTPQVGSRGNGPIKLSPRERKKRTVMRAKKPKRKEEDLVRRYQDLLKIVRLVSWCMNRDHLIKTRLDHIGLRLRKRARYILMEGDELMLDCWVDRYLGLSLQYFVKFRT